MDKRESEPLNVLLGRGGNKSFIIITQSNNGSILKRSPFLKNIGLFL